MEERRTIEFKIGDLVWYHPGLRIPEHMQGATYLGQGKDDYHYFWFHDLEKLLPWGHGKIRFLAEIWSVVSCYEDCE